MKDRLEIWYLRRILKLQLEEFERLQNRNTRAINFIEKYTDRFEGEPYKLGLSIKETVELLKLLRGEYDER